MHRPIATLIRDQRGLTTVEYAIVLCLIAAAAVGAWGSFGETITTHLNRATVKIDDELRDEEKPPP